MPFLCRHCSKRFETYNSLIKHKNRIHAEEKPLKKACEHCGKVYLDPKALRYSQYQKCKKKAKDVSVITVSIVSYEMSPLSLLLTT